MRVIKIIMLALCFAGITADLASAASYKFTRRTIHTAAHDRPLSFDAPEGMCFLDQTKPREGMAFDELKSRALRGTQVLAVFANCLEIVNLGEKGSTGIQNGGWIGWLNPEVGDRTGMSRQDYLDMMEPSFAKRVGRDAETIRTETAVKGGLVHDDEFIDGLKKSTDVAATTEIGGIPLVFFVNFTRTSEPYPLDTAYAYMDKFVASAILKNGK